MRLFSQRPHTPDIQRSKLSLHLILRKKKMQQCKVIVTNLRGVMENHDAEERQDSHMQGIVDECFRTPQTTKQVPANP